MNAVGWLVQQLQVTERSLAERLRRALPVPANRPTASRWPLVTRAAIRHRGFSLVELMVTITIGGILLAVAVPSFTLMVASNRLQSQTGNLVLSLNLARSEAIKQNVAAGVAVTATAGSWTNGWSVCCAAGAATVLQRQGAVGNSITVKAANPAGALATLTYDSNGALLNGAGNVIFTFCDSHGSATAREVEVDMAGRIQTAGKAGFRADQKTALVCP